MLNGISVSNSVAFIFTRATLCIARSLLSSGVRLSVRLPRWWMYPHGWRYRQTSCSPGRLITLVFLTPAPIPNSKGNPFSGGAKYTGWKNFATIDWNRRLSRKRFEIGPWLLWNVNRKSQVAERYASVPMTLRDFDPDFKVTTFFRSRISQKRRVLGIKLL